MKRGIAALVILGGILWVATRGIPSFFSPSAEEAPSEASPQVVVKPDTHLPKHSTQATGGPMEAAKRNTGCFSLRDALKELDMGKLAKSDTTLPELPASATCSDPDVPAWLTEARLRYEKACLENPPATPVEKRNCLFSAYLLRAGLTDFLTPDGDIGSVRDAGILGEKLLSSLQRRDVDRTIALGERLLVLDPDNRSAGQALLMGYLQSATDQRIDSNDALWEKVDGLLRQQRRLRPPGAASDSRTRLYADYLRYRDPERLDQEARRALRRNPQDPAPSWFQALAANERGDRQGAIAILTRQQGDAQSAQTLERFRRGDSQPFRVDLSASFDVLDIPED